MRFLALQGCRFSIGIVGGHKHIFLCWPDQDERIEIAQAVQAGVVVSDDLFGAKYGVVCGGMAVRNQCDIVAESGSFAAGAVHAILRFAADDHEVVDPQRLQLLVQVCAVKRVCRPYEYFEAYMFSFTPAPFPFADSGFIEWHAPVKASVAQKSGISMQKRTSLPR